jgi:integrase
LGQIALRGGNRVKPKDESKLETTKAGTINRELAALSHLLHKALEWGWINSMPVKINMLKDEARRIDYLTVAECQRLREFAKADDNDQIYPFIVIGLEAAMRRMEILSIRREHVDLAGRTIFIPKAKAGARTQPIPQSLAQYLETYMALLPTNVQWLFPSPRSITGHTMDVRKAFRRVVIAAGLDPDKVLRHTLRHTAITQFSFTLVNLPTLQK